MNYLNGKCCWLSLNLKMKKKDIGGTYVTYCISFFILMMKFNLIYVKVVLMFGFF